MQTLHKSASSSVFTQAMRSGEEVQFGKPVFVVVMKRGKEVGAFKRKPSGEIQTYKSRAYAIRGALSMRQRDGGSQSWVAINSSELASCDLIWL